MTFIYVSTLITLMLFSQKVRGPQTTHVVWQDNLVPAGNILVTAALVQKKSTHWYVKRFKRQCKENV